MKKSELRKIIREVISEQITMEPNVPIQRSNQKMGLDPRIMNVLTSRNFGELKSNLNKAGIPEADVIRISKDFDNSDPVPKAYWTLVAKILIRAGYVLYGYALGSQDPDLQEQSNVKANRVNVSTNSPSKYVPRTSNITPAEAERMYNKLGRPNTIGNFGAALIKAGVEPQEVNKAIKGRSPSTVISSHLPIVPVISFLLKRGALIGLGYLIGGSIASN